MGKLNLIDELSKLSPVNKIYEELENESEVENVVGFLPCGDYTDCAHHILNIGTYLAMQEKNVCIVDAQVFYPCIYRLLDTPLEQKGRGVLKLLRDDRVDIREEIKKTSIDNLYLVSASPFDAMEDYFDIDESAIERMFTSLKEVFDIVLVNIPNNPPLEFCYVTVKTMSVGFLMWSQRQECPVNTKRLFHFLNSIGISTAKLGNVIYCNSGDVSFDISVVNNMGLKLIANFPYVSQVFDLALEGKVYIRDATFLDKRYKNALMQLGRVLG